MLREKIPKSMFFVVKAKLTNFLCLLFGLSGPFHKSKYDFYSLLFVSTATNFLQLLEEQTGL
jgi:hypothetical protein